VPLCDGHDSAIMTVNHELVRHGAEVVYLGYHQAASTIARAALQEDAHAVGISSYNGGHVVFLQEVVRQLRARGADDIAVFAGGGSTITEADARRLRLAGVCGVFFAGTPFSDIIRELTAVAKPRRQHARLVGDRALARAITQGESKDAPGRSRGRRRTGTSPNGTFVLGVAGPGGAGKSTLIDELVFRFLQAHPSKRVAVLANDPSHADSGGALLGDRVAALYARNDRVFFRSLASRGSPTGLARGTVEAIRLLRRSGEFAMIIVESVGIGQDSDPFQSLRPGAALTDAVLFVMSPHYGGRLQLEKIALLPKADLLVLNKCDDARATSARAELQSVLSLGASSPSLHLTIAARHQDRGVDLLYAAVADLAEIDATGGERSCQLRLHP
jgi:methylmalonyl-CoA mutase